jgi:glycosyltransferase involved in cell wall biosynthesis
LHVAFSLLTLEPGGVGGSETYARGLLRAYAGGPDEITVLAGPGAAPSLRELEGGPVRVREIAAATLGTGRGGRAAGLLRGLARPPAEAVAAAEEADVLHLPLTVPIPRTRATPTVLTLFDLLHHDVQAMFPRAERGFRRVAYERAARRADRVVTVSEHSRERIAARLGIPRERIAAIVPGIDHARFHPGPAAPAGVPEPPWVLYPAALWPHKNHARLLEALARVPGVSLVLTGATFDREAALRAKAAQLGVAERVHHLGFVPAGTLPELYRAASALVFPSLAEGFGQPVLEAMASGCPVAASNTGAVAEAAGDAALLFDPTDVSAIAAAITRAIGDADLRSAGIEHARAYTWERAAAEHRAVYADAISSPSRRRSRPPARRRR